ncbi:MAG: glycosyltransferase family 4 protein [Gammaproteobacteria bacterium]|nr:glycosyltransferase family 4 protein [Gammaproteobacteria bacterium]
MYSDGASPGFQNLCYLASAPVPSAAANAVHVAHMCEALSDLGFCVTLLSPCSHPWKKDLASELRAYFGIKANFDVVGIWQSKIRWPYLQLLGRYLSRANPNWVYGRKLSGCGMAAKKGFPTIFEAHLPAWTRGWRVRREFEFLIKQPAFAGLVVISRSLRDAFLEKYPNLQEKIVIAPDGAPDWVSPEPNLLTPNGELHVGYVGGLYPGKGIELIVKLAPTCPWARFVVVGGTEREISNWRSILPRGSDNVEFVGWRPHAEVREYLSRANVLIAPYQPSVEAHGGGGELAPWMSPLKVFEYMAAGRPIIASDLPVLREVLNNEVNALMVVPDDIVAWRTALDRLRTSPEVAQRLARNARREFEEKYTWNARARRIVRAFDGHLK